MNAFDGLSSREIQLIGASLAAAANGDFFPDWEFETLFGLTMAEVNRIAESWPATMIEPKTELAVINTLVNLLGYPHGKDDKLHRTVGTSEELAALLDKLQPSNAE